MAKRFRHLSRKLIPFIIAGLTILAIVTAASFSLLHPQAVSAQQVSRGDGYVSIGLPSTGNQDDNWSCGPNSAARVLAFYGHNVVYDTLRSAVNQEFILPPSVNVPAPTLTDWNRTRRVDIRTGTTPHVLRDVMQRWEGNNVRLERRADFSDLLRLLREGKPVITLLRVGSIPPEQTLSGTWPAMHWLAVRGFNEGERRIYVTDTDGTEGYYTYDEFLEMWDWSVGAGFASEALNRNGVQAKTMIWVDRVAGGITASNQQNRLYIRSFNGETFGEVSSSQAVSGADRFRGWSWDGSRASYVAFENGQSTLIVRPFDGQTLGSVSSSQVVSSSDSFRGWSWDGSRASYVVVDGTGQSTLIIRPFDGRTLGSVTSSQTVSDRDVFRGWSWDGSRASYVASENGRSTLIVRPFDGRTFGSVSSSQAVSDRDVFRGWSWDGGRASYIAE